MTLRFDVVEEVLHALIDAVTGHANINPVRALELHENVTPGYNDKPLTDEEKAQLARLQQIQDRYDTDQLAKKNVAEEQAKSADLQRQLDELRAQQATSQPNPTIASSAPVNDGTQVI